VHRPSIIFRLKVQCFACVSMETHSARCSLR